MDGLQVGILMLQIRCILLNISEIFLPKIVFYYYSFSNSDIKNIHLFYLLSTIHILIMFYRSLRTREKSIHRQLYLAMLIQVIIRLVLYTDQLVSRKDLEESASQTPNRGIDNTVSLEFCDIFYISKHIIILWPNSPALNGRSVH